MNAFVFTAILAMCLVGFVSSQASVLDNLDRVWNKVTTDAESMSDKVVLENLRNLQKNYQEQYDRMNGVDSVEFKQVMADVMAQYEASPVHVDVKALINAHPFQQRRVVVADRLDELHNLVKAYERLVAAQEKGDQETVKKEKKHTFSKLFHLKKKSKSSEKA